MYLKVGTLAIGLAALMSPSVVSARVLNSDATSPITQTFAYSLGVNADCTLSLDTTGIINFAPVSGLGWNAEFTSLNNAYANCSATAASVALYDAWEQQHGPLSYFELVTTHGLHMLYYVCPNTNGTSCYQNNTTGFAVGNTGLTTVPMYGYLLHGFATPPGTYTDLVTVALAFN